METTRYRLLEFFIIFIILPVSFAFQFSTWIKMSIGFSGFLYVIFVLLKVERNTFKIAPDLDWKSFWKQTALKFLVIALVTALYVYVVNPAHLFNVILNKPKLWGMILFIYSVFSVYPQELVYRTFFFQRYETLFKSTHLFIFLNAVLFSLGHIFFKNPLVIVLTFLGGLLFSITFTKTKSTLLVSVEHAIYGCWLFTVGMGAMLGFPA